MSHTVFLAFGSNLGNRKENLSRALELLKHEGLKPVSVSLPVITAPEGFESSNQVLKITQRIERTLGRMQKSHDGIYHDRTMDIDILFYDNETINTPELTIPHPKIAERLFVLRPLCEIAPLFRHPVTGKTIRELLDSACRQ